MSFKPYTQNSIPYFYVCNDEETKKEYCRFIYRWRQVQTNMQGLTYIYCKSLEDLEALIEYWNRQEYWEYRIENEDNNLMENAA